MNHRSFASAALLCLALVPLGGCSRAGRTTVTLAGSTAFQPFAEKLAEHYMASRKGIQINVQGGGSAVGIQAALAGAADVGMADLLEIPPEAKGLASIVVARDGIAIVVNPRNPVSALTPAQARGIFTGSIADWNDVGGGAGPVRVISREEGSGTRRSFDKLVLGAEKLAAGALFQNSNGTCREAVASDAGAIGYLSIGLVNGRVKALAYDGVAPTNDNVKAGKYPLARPVFFLTKGEPAPHVADFIAFVLSPEGQGILEKEGLIAAR